MIYQILKSPKLTMLKSILFHKERIFNRSTTFKINLIFNHNKHLFKKITQTTLTTQNPRTQKQFILTRIINNHSIKIKIKNLRLYSK